MTFTLQSVADRPDTATYSLTLKDGEKIILRPLEPKDVNELHAFLQGLSEETRRLSTFEGYDFAAATELCQAINKYDKLRFVVETVANPAIGNRMVGLIEFSFDIPESDVERYKLSGYNLNQNTDCRFGPTLSDDYQGKGLGSKLFPFVIEIARQFDKKRIILWGGVLKDNERAIHYYEKYGFKSVGTFGDTNKDKLDMVLEIKP